MKGLALFSTLVIGALASPTSHKLDRRDDVTAVVNLADTRGASKHVASGYIYGIPDTLNQIPDHWYTDIDFNYGRAGGAQLGAPSVCFFKPQVMDILLIILVARLDLWLDRV